MPAPAQARSEPRLALGRVRMRARAEARWLGELGPSLGSAAFFGGCVGPALASALAPLMEGGDPSVWVIRRLDVQVVAEGGAGAGPVGRALARSVCAAVVRVLAGSGGAVAVRFADRAAYLAQFLDDLAEERAWDRWYYGVFADLRPLPLGSAVCLALERERPQALAALAALDARGRLDRLAGRIGEGALLRVCGLVAPPPPAPQVPHGLVAAVSRLMAQTQGAGPAPTPAQFRLRAVVAAARAGIGAPPAAVAAAAERAFAAGRPGAVAAGRPAAGEPGARPPVRAAPREPRALGARARAGARAAAPALPPGWAGGPVAAPGPEPMATAAAGVFLLWRSVRALDLDGLVAAGRSGPAAAARRLVLAARLAGPQWRVALADPALRWLAGLAGMPDEAGLAEALRFAPDEARAAEATLAARLLERCSPGPRALLYQRAGRTIVLQDAERQDWLAAAPGIPPDPGFADPASIILGSGIARRRLPPPYRGWSARPIGARARCLARDRPDAAACAAARKALAALRPAAPDLAHLGAAEDASDRRSTLLWALVARAAHSDLARRLPGLALSSAAYLGRSVLAGTGTLVRRGDGHDAVLTLPRVPLELVLRVTGLDRTVLGLADGRTVLIRLPGPGPC